MKGSKVLFGMIILLLLAGVMGGAKAQSARTYIPPQAMPHLPVLSKELDLYFKTIPHKEMIPGLIDHETCPGYKYYACWKPNAELKNDREQGVGLGQLTRAWDKQGKLRFDNLEGMRKRYPAELSDLSWTNVKTRPDLQMRTIVLMVKDEYTKFHMVPNKTEALKMSAAAYNGGSRDILRARNICGITKGCDPNVLFDNVDKHCVKSRTPDKRYGNRSMCDINTAYPRDIFQVRMDKYKPYMK